MPIAQVVALVLAGQQLVASGVATLESIRDFIKSIKPGIAEADLNAICDGIAVGAARHKALAVADAGGA